VQIARQIAEALEAAHEAGIIHRDVKPANIKVRNDGTVKVLDFGLAKVNAPAEAGALADTEGRGFSPDNSPTFTSPAMTAAGIILGTAAYMSPEQARGQPVDKRADIWAFGCVLYEMLTGKPPFDGHTITDVIAAVVKSEPDWGALHAPPRLRALITRCLQKEPRQRLRDIGDARLELADPLFAAAPEASRSTPSYARGWLAVVALLILTAGVATGVIWQRTRASSNEVASSLWTGTRLGGPSVVLNPRVSPDGQLVAFATSVDNLSQVAVMKPESGNWTVLTRDRTQGLTWAISWAPDSSRI
jgi:serine/threonine protein kinase